MALPTPLTAAQVDGAIAIGEVPVLFLVGPNQGMFLTVDVQDPNLPSALVNQEVQWAGTDPTTLNITSVPLVITEVGGGPVTNPPAAYPLDLELSINGDIPTGQNFALLYVDGYSTTVPVTESGIAGDITYTALWTAPGAGSHSLELLMATGELGAHTLILDPVVVPLDNDPEPPVLDEDF